MQAQARWVPHELNCTDCLTKKKGNTQALLQLLQKGTYRLVITEDELKRRKEEREATGKRNARPKRLNVNSEVDGRKRHSRYPHAQDREQAEGEFRSESSVPGPSCSLAPSRRKFYSSQYSSPKNVLRDGRQSAEKPVKVLYQCCSSGSEEEAAAEESFEDLSDDSFEELSAQVADPVLPQEPVLW